jgi:molybdopterin-containing oxidoreductase family iron-sulfur binding subunit
MHVEPRLSLTAANADAWFKNTPSTGVPVLAAVFRALCERDDVVQRLPEGMRARLVSLSEGIDVTASLEGSGLEKAQIDRIVERLLAAPVSLVVAGGPSVSGDDAVVGGILATLCNLVLGNIGKTVFVHRGMGKARSGYEEMLRLIEDMKAEKVGVLVISGVNPAYALPEEAGFIKAIGKVGAVVSVSAHMDETTALAQIVLPQSTSFERWDDSEPAPGLWNLNQPAMQPLYKDGSQSFGDTILALLKVLGKPVQNATTFYDYLRLKWRERTGEANFEERWTGYVEKGGDWPESGRLERPTAIPSLALGVLRPDGFKPVPVKDGDLALMVFPTINSFDGSSANRAWMQELPNPITTAVWGSWVEMHPTLAERNKFKHGEVIQVLRALSDGSMRAVELPIFVTKNIHPSLVAIPLGQGHESYGRYAKGIGVNALTLLGAGSKASQALTLPGVQLRKGIMKGELVRTQGSDSQHGRGLLREVSVKDYVSGEHLEDLQSSHGHGGDSHGADGAGAKGHSATDNHGGVQYAAKQDKNGHGSPDKEHKDAHGNVTDDRFPGVTKHAHGHQLGPQPLPKQMYAQMEHPVYRWGMSIDLNSCSGCSACVVACYAENNIAVIGREMVARGRHMAWINIQRYFDETSEERPIAGFLPMLCQHCPNAPCEPVCPVYATYHNEEGLNSMVYNRCVGTRYCLNNCSYQVRRFNWFRFWWPEPLTWQLNPHVTVREVGVMEKCSFCVQRIREAQHVAKDLGRPVQDGEVNPACASSCPTGAIKFGNLLDKKSKVAADAQSPRGYKILDAMLNTQPAITYLARVRAE